MIVNGIHYRTIREKPDDDKTVQVIDQRFLPFKFVIEDIHTVDDIIKAIKEMHVRGAPLIGVTAAYGVYFGLIESASKNNFETYFSDCINRIKASRPTAINLSWAVDEVLLKIKNERTIENKISIALQTAGQIAEDDVTNCKKIGEYGFSLLEEISKKKNGKQINILTHCNAGWLATVDYGTATAPIYTAFERGIDLHVWVDETRPRNQGGKLTAWELAEMGIPHSIIADNTGGHLMQHGLVDIVIVGSDRTTYTGDLANKIGTYLKALAAYDNNVPFYAALPSSTIDWNVTDGIKEIPIETRDEDEILFIDGLRNNEVVNVRIANPKSKAVNYAFDVTPHRLVTGLITERGIVKANKEDILKLFPERIK